MSAAASHKLAAILSADVVGYARLMAEDEDETVRRVGVAVLTRDVDFERMRRAGLNLLLVEV